MYNPPSETNWVEVGSFQQVWADCYNEGYNHAKAGCSELKNPYELSGHERDMTFSDRANYWWACGWLDFHN